MVSECWDDVVLYRAELCYAQLNDCTNDKNLMLCRLAFLFWILGFCGVRVFATDYTSLHYDFSAAHIHESYIEVTLTMKGDLSEPILLNLPFKWADSSYQAQIRNVEIMPRSIVFDRSDGKVRRWMVTAPKHTRTMTVTYQVHTNGVDALNVHDAIVRSDLVHAPGYGLLITPDDAGANQSIDVSMQWRHLPEGWQVLSSHSDARFFRQQLRIDALRHALYLAGKFRLYHHNNPDVRVALYGQLSAKDAFYVSAIEKILSSQRDFFRDHDFPPYAVSILASAAVETLEATMLQHGFAAHVPAGHACSAVVDLLAHENVHSWFGGGARLDTFQVNPILNYWFQEGFTEYYAQLIAYRSGRNSRATFVKNINRHLQHYGVSPARLMRNDAIAQRFHEDDWVRQLPYSRGVVFALYLDDEIKKRRPHCSLDDVMLKMLARSRKFSVPLFQQVLREVTGHDFKKAFVRYIDNGEPVPLHGLSLPMFKKVYTTYVSGVDNKVLLEEKRIARVDHSSAAYTVGLRDGQRVVSYDMPVAVGQPVRIRTEQSWFTYVPRQFMNVVYYQLQP